MSETTIGGVIRALDDLVDDAILRLMRAPLS